MRRAKIVIGANYGDEGKGLLVDYYTARSGPMETVVVRFNGGAQAGHTVQTPEGIRHVFSHFGSGTLLGAPTCLSEFFIVNPILYHAELAKLKALGVRPYVLVDREASVTTPMDMWLNMAAEDARGPDRHGSVGVGINETLERADAHADIRVNGLRDEAVLRTTFKRIVEEWLPERVKQLGCQEQFERQKPQFDANRWIADCQTFLQSVRLTSTQSTLLRYRHVIFEGAQGLGLDMHVHPVYATPSPTGLENVLNLIQETGILSLDVTYVTRSYLTRHGAGPLEHELSGPPHTRVVDTTNKVHPYQGTLRFAHLDVAALWNRIERDTKLYSAVDFVDHVRLAVTCMDQVDKHTWWNGDSEQHHGNSEDFLAAVVGPAEKLLVSTGPTRNDITDLGTTHTGFAFSEAQAC